MALRPIGGARRNAAVIIERAEVKQARADTRTEVAGINANISALTASMATLQVHVDGWDAYTNAQKFTATKDVTRELKTADKIVRDLSRTAKGLVKAALE